MKDQKMKDQKETQFSRRFILRALFYAAAALSLLGCDRLIGLNSDEVEKSDGEKDKSAAEPVKPEAELTAEESEEPAGDGSVPKRLLGRTGVEVGIIGLGGSFLISEANKAEEAEKLIEQALEAGINYIDTAPSYSSSEVNIGKAMPRLRSKVFLATKTIDRTYDGTMRLFEQSLKSLQTDYIDLLQLHGFQEQGDYDRTFSSDGAFKALEQLKAEGAVRFIGITSHKNPQIIKQAISDYEFDCILFSLNPAERHDQAQSFLEEVLPLASAKEMGTIAMKVASYGRIFKSGGIENMQQALDYTLSFPVSTAIIGISNQQELEENIEIAKGFKTLSDSELAELESLVKPYYSEASFFKTAW